MPPRRRRLVGATLAAAAIAAAALGLAACFSPVEPACAFSCVTAPHLCPAHYTCGADLICHRDGADPDAAACPLIVPDDAAADAAPE